MNMQGLVILNSSWLSDSVCLQAKRLSEELEKLSICVKTVCGEALDFNISRDGGVFLPSKPDFAVYLNKDLYLGRLLEKSGVRLFNPVSAVEICDDKFLTYSALLNKDVPMPKTLPSLLVYNNRPCREENRKTYLSKIISELGLPVVIKESRGSLGKQVYLARTEKELYSIDETLVHVPRIYQEYISESEGRDVRCIVIGKKIAACMLRKNEKDFRSNIALGATAVPYKPDARLIELCEKTAEAVDADYCGIDLLFEKERGYLLCEINSNCFFEEMERVTGKNIAALYAEHIAKSLNVR